MALNKHILKNFLIVLALFDFSFQLTLIILWVIITSLLVFEILMKTLNHKNHQYVVVAVELMTGVLLAFKCQPQQLLALIILIGIEKLIQKIIFIASLAVNSVIENKQQPPYYYQIGYLFIIGVLIGHNQLKKQKSQKTENTPIKDPLKVDENNQPSVIMNNNEIESKSQSPQNQYMENLNSGIMPDLQNSDHEILLQKMAWIHNQSILVFNEKMEIIYQNFFIGNYLKNGAKNDGSELEHVFLNSIILIGNRDVIDLFGESEEINSESIILNISNNSRYKITGRNKISDMITILYDQFSRWKFFTFTIHKIQSEKLDFDKSYIKVFVNEIRGKVFSFFVFEDAPIQIRRNIDEPKEYSNIFTTFLSESNNFMNTIHLFVLLCLHEIEKNSNAVLKEYLVPMRMVTLKHMIFLQNMKDLTQQIHNQLICKNIQFRINDIIDEIIMIYDDCFKIKGVRLLPKYDADHIINNDQDRTKQILKVLIDIVLKYTTNQTIRIDIKQMNQGIIISIKDIPLKNEQQRSQILGIIKQATINLKSNHKDFDLSQNLELQTAVILSFYLSGQARKVLDLNWDLNSITFNLQIDNIQSKQILQTQLKPRRYFETSLSMLLANAQDSSQYRNQEDSRLLTLTQFSKQYSVKEDLQSAHFSQISKIKQDSPQTKQLSNQRSISGTYKLHQESLYLPNTIKVIKSESAANDSSNKAPTSVMDFGDSSNPSLDPPELNPKFLNSIIKFKLTNKCCSKVLISDNDYFSVQILSILLHKYDVKSDRSFSRQQTFNEIAEKAKHPCVRCKNRSYLLYFIDVQYPTGLEIISELKKMFNTTQIDKGFTIATSSFSDIEVKLQCFNLGIDYFLGKPFDLFELNAILQYLQF